MPPRPLCTPTLLLQKQSARETKTDSPVGSRELLSRHGSQRRYNDEDDGDEWTRALEPAPGLRWSRGGWGRRRSASPPRRAAAGAARPSCTSASSPTETS
eukprot:8714405-Pyramimonas_sp.AAC.1